MALRLLEPLTALCLLRGDGWMPQVVVRDMVDAAYRPLMRAKVTQFVPALVDRTVRERLRMSRV